jgi:hypothetical protein
MKAQISPWVSRNITINGEKMLQFQCSAAYTPRQPKQSRQWQMDRKSWTLWVEPQTLQIRRREVRTRYASSAKSVETVKVEDQFKYNLTPPKGVFEVVPPPGTKYSFVPLPQRHATADEQEQIETVVRSALEAWNRKDFKGFGSAWDFDYMIAPRSQTGGRKRFVLQSAPQILSRKVSLKTISRASSRDSGIFTQNTSAQGFPPKEPAEFRAVAMTQVVAGNGGKMERPLLLNLSRQEDGTFKIIRWYPIKLHPQPHAKI